MLLQFQVTGQDQLDALMRGLRQALDTKQILDEGAALLFNRMRSRFLLQQAPDGSKWPVSQASLRRDRTGRGGGTLFDTGKLWYSLQVFADSATTRAIGTNRTNVLGFPYPIMHQYGLGIFPRRQFLGFGQEDVQTMTDLIVFRLSKVLTTP